MKVNSHVEIYQSPDGHTEVQVTFDKDTVWLNQEQLGQLFDRDRTVVSRHIKNIFKEGELDESVVCANFTHTTEHGAIKGKTQSKTTRYYNLDVIISVGYRVKSIRGTQFRQWASKRLKDYLIQGYSINEKRLEQKNQMLTVLKSGIQILGRAIEETAQEEGIEWLSKFAKGLALLDDYDHERLESEGLTLKPATYPTKEDYQFLINQMKLQFNSDVFGFEKTKASRVRLLRSQKVSMETIFIQALRKKRHSTLPHN